MRYHRTPVRMAVIKKNTKTNVAKDAEKKELIHCFWECKLMQTLENSIEVYEKTKNKTI